MPDDCAENDPAWMEACRREEAIRDLLRRYPDRMTLSAVEGVAWELGLSRATLYRLIERYPVDYDWGCKPKPPKIPSGQIQPRDDRIQVNHPPVVAKGIASIQMDMAPGRRRIFLIMASAFTPGHGPYLVSNRDRMAEL